MVATSYTGWYGYVLKKNLKQWVGDIKEFGYNVSLKRSLLFTLDLNPHVEYGGNLYLQAKILSIPYLADPCT